MSYPITIAGFRDALFAYAPPEDIEAAISDAQGQRSIVNGCVKAFKTLQDAEALATDGLQLLCSAAHLIAANGWHGLAGDAATVLATRAQDLPPAPESDSAVE